MRRLLISMIVVAAMAVGAPLRAQDPFNVAVPVDKLSALLTTLYGPGGLVVDSRTQLPSGATHSAHFNSAFQSGFTQFNVALATQLASAPLPSPASGFTYEFDPDLGVFNRSTVSFGPIFTERAETIGSKQFSTGLTFQQFRFDTIEGVDLEHVPAVFTHDGFEQGGGRGDLVTTTNAIDARVSQLVAFLTYGLTDSLDVSLAVPLVSTDLTVVSDSVVRRIGTTNPETHFFNTSSDEIGDRRIFTAFGSASGIGDLTLRLKQTVKRSGWGAMALALDVRLPTGDEEQLLGSGAPGIKPFLIWSNSYGIVSPHVNAGYEWNGSSILAGNPETGESGELADRALLAFGADLGVSSRFTLAFDILGQWFIDTPQLVTQDFVAQNGEVFPDITFRHATFSEWSGAIGFKLNVVRELLIDANVLFSLNDSGLRTKITPMLGIEYAF